MHMQPKDLLIVSVCDESGVILEPWARVGFRCVALDLQPSRTGTHKGIEFQQGDVRRYRLPCREKIALFFAWPPCTDLAVSGSRWFTSKGLFALRDAIDLVAHCELLAESSGAPWMIENPVGTLSTYWRKPDYYFDPCDYGDPYTKKTCVWAGNGFVMPPKSPVQPTEGSKMHLLPRSKDRQRLRSVTPLGFALAVFKAHYPLVCDKWGLERKELDGNIPESTGEVGDSCSVRSVLINEAV